MKKISLIVADASPLITLSIAGELDTLLLPQIRVVIPDMVKYEVTRYIEKQGAAEVLEWIRNHEPVDVYVASTEVYDEFVVLNQHMPKVKSKGRGEQAASEVLGRELAHNPEAAILLFEDSDILKDNFLMKLPDNVVILSTSAFLDGLVSLKLIKDADEILDKAVGIRGEKILERTTKVTNGFQDCEDDWKSGLNARSFLDL